MKPARAGLSARERFQSFGRQKLSVRKSRVGVLKNVVIATPSGASGKQSRRSTGAPLDRGAASPLAMTRRPDQACNVDKRARDFNLLGAKVCNFFAADRRKESPKMKVATRPCTCTRYWGRQASGTLPSSGADSIFSSVCGAISRRRAWPSGRPAPRSRRPKPPRFKRSTIGCSRLAVATRAARRPSIDGRRARPGGTASAEPDNSVVLLEDLNLEHIKNALSHVKKLLVSCGIWLTLVKIAVACPFRLSARPPACGLWHSHKSNSRCFSLSYKGRRVPLLREAGKVAEGRMGCGKQSTA